MDSNYGKNLLQIFNIPQKLTGYNYFVDYKVRSVIKHPHIHLLKDTHHMSFFSSILQKLGLGKKDQPAAVAPAAAPAQPAAPVAKPAAPVAAAKPVVAAPATPATTVAKPAFDPLSSLPTAAKPVVAAPIAVSEVDVVKHLETLSAGSGLDWKVSIVDLLKLLEIDSSHDARKELATELGCPADLMGDSAKMNVWLHKEVLKQIAKNGGNIPASMLD
jgi:hypothetical protein